MNTRPTWSPRTGLRALAITALLAGSAEAGNIQQLTTSSGSVAPEEDFQVTVRRGGSGNCGVRLHFGDGASAGPFGFPVNPRVFTHHYSQAGTYTLTAKPRKKNNLAKCNGSAKTTTVTVTGGTPRPRLVPAGPTDLKPIAPKTGGKPKTPPPGVRPPGADSRMPENVGIPHKDCGDRFGVDSIHASPPLDPGEDVYISGCGFGMNRGELRLLGDFPGGYLKLDHIGWRPTRATGRVPMVTGVQDMPAAKLQVVRSDGKSTNWIDVGGFRATRDVVTIHPLTVSANCASLSSSDTCSLANNYPPAADAFFVGSSFAARHTRQVSPKSDCSAVEMLGESWLERKDQAVVLLANGWKIRGFHWWWTKLEGNGKVSTPTGVQVGASSSTIEIAWGLRANRCSGSHVSQLRYKLEIFAEGPKGVPYR